jgi:hypothetical protein
VTRRTVRIILNLITLLSLLLCLATVWLWVRSHGGSDVLNWGGWWIDGPPADARDVRVCENVGFVRTRPGYLALWRRTQETQTPPAAASDLVARAGWKAPKLTSTPAGSGVLFNSPAPAHTLGEQLGFYYRISPGRSPTTHYYDAAAPLWAIVTLFALTPFAWLAGLLTRRRRRRSAMAANRCRGCGYDLRASALRCPECGLAIGMTDLGAAPHSGHRSGVARRS